MIRIKSPLSRTWKLLEENRAFMTLVVGHSA